MTTTTRHDPRDCATCAVGMCHRCGYFALVDGDCGVCGWPSHRSHAIRGILIALLVSALWWGVFVIAPLWWRFR